MKHPTILIPLLLTAFATTARPDAVHFIAGECPEKAAAAAWVGPDAAYYITSGAVAEPVDDSIPMGATERYDADVYQQSVSTFQSLNANLGDAGLTASDVVFVRVYLEPDTEGNLPLEAFEKAYDDWFGTPANPNRPPVSVTPIEALALPGLKVEIELVAVYPDVKGYHDFDPAGGYSVSPRVSSHETEGSFIARGKGLAPQTPLYWTSGSIPEPVDRSVHLSEWRMDGDVYEQAISTLEGIEDTLSSVGLGMADVIFLRALLVDEEAEIWGDSSTFAKWNRAYGAFFNNRANPNKPARSTVFVPPYDIENMLLEVEVVAAFPDTRGPFTEIDSASANPKVIADGPPGYPIAAGKAVDRRTPLMWTGTLLPRDTTGNMAAQSGDVLGQAKDLLARKGMDMDDIVFLRAYYVPSEDDEAARTGWDQAYARAFTGEKPTRTFLPVPVLADPDARVSIDIIAAGE